MYVPSHRYIYKCKNLFFNKMLQVSGMHLLGNNYSSNRVQDNDVSCSSSVRISLSSVKMKLTVEYNPGSLHSATPSPDCFHSHAQTYPLYSYTLSADNSMATKQLYEVCVYIVDFCIILI